MANGAPRIFQQQRAPGALEQFIGALQQNLPQNLQQLGQQRQERLRGEEEASLQRMLDQIAAGQEEGIPGSGGQQPLEGLQQPQQQQQQPDTTQEMLQSLSQMGVQPQQQTPQQMLGGLQQGAPGSDQLQSILQSIMPQQQQQQQTPFQQEAQQKYQQQQQNLPQMQGPQPDPETAENQPVLSQEQFTDLYRDLQGQPGQRIQSIGKQLDAVKYSSTRSDLKKEKRKELEKKQDQLEQRQETIQQREEPKADKIEDSMMQAQEANQSLAEVRRLSDQLAEERTGVTGFAQGAWDWLMSQAGDLRIKYYGASIGPLRKLSELKSTTSREFEAARGDSISQMQQVYGNQVSKGQMKEFIKKFPKAFDNQETRDKMINHLERSNQIAIKRGKVLDQIKRANNGYLPRDVTSLVNKYVADDIDQATREFKDILNDIRQQENGGKQSQNRTRSQQGGAQSPGLAFDLDRYTTAP